MQIKGLRPKFGLRTKYDLIIKSPSRSINILLIYYPPNATLECVLSDISSAVNSVFCMGTDISAMVRPIDLKVCVMVDGGDIFRGLQMRGQKRGSSGTFLASQTDFCHLTANISKTVSHRVRCHLLLYFKCFIIIIYLLFIYLCIIIKRLTLR